MDDEKTHYQVLGLKPGARHTEIGIAYQRLMGRRRAEHAPPDPKLDARIQEAYDILSDIEQREYYDAELRAKVLARPGSRGRIALGVVALAALAGGAGWLFRPAAPRDMAGEAAQNIVQAAAPAVGKLERLQVSGTARSSGIAFSMDEGVMVASCRDLAPGTQLMVSILGREVAASVRSFDEATGLCQLTAPATGSWPLKFSGTAPKPGDAVYAASFDARGEITVKKGTVERVADTPQGASVRTTLAMRAEDAGAPLFDADGRVIAVATLDPGGQPVHMVPPAQWTADSSVVRPRPGKSDSDELRSPAEATSAAKPPAEATPGARPPFLSTDPAEVRRRAEKAYGKTTVPDDL